jgi:hypothetical protein
VRDLDVLDNHFRRPMHYRLEGKTPVPANDVLEWARWYDKANRHVADTTIGRVRVSTVFLGLDHSFSRGGDPVLFETLIFGGPLDQEGERYTSWDEALKGHAAAVERVKEARTIKGRLKRFSISIRRRLLR